MLLLKNPPAPDAVDEVTVLLNDEAEFYEFGTPAPLPATDLSSSNSLSFINTFDIYLYRSSSSKKASGNTNVLFLFTKFDVPALPET